MFLARRWVAIALAAATVSCSSAPRRPPVVEKPEPKSESAGNRVGQISLYGIPELPERIRQQMYRYLAVRRTRFADWDRRGSGMVIRTRFGSTMQAHHVRHPLGEREQLSFGNEPIASTRWIPGGFDGALLLQKDRGGAENHQLYRLQLLEGKLTRLTGGKSRTAGYCLSDKGQLAFASNARNGHDFDIYLMKSTAKGNKNRLVYKLIYKAKGLFLPLDFSPDSSALLLLQYISRNESYLHVLDLASGKASPVAGADKKQGGSKIAYRQALWDADGHGIYLTSDRDGERVRLYHYDLAKRAFRSLTKDIEWDVEQIALSSDRHTLAFTVNAGGYSKLHLLSTRNGSIKPVDIPAGIVSNLRFASAKRADLLGFTHESPTRPADAYGYDIRRHKLERWTRSEVGGLVTDFFVKPKLIEYPTFDKVDGKPRKIPAFYYKPPGRGPHPVLIHIHGGPESQYRPRFSGWLQYLALELGMAVIAPNVRGSDGYGKSYLLLDNGKKREDSVKDIGALLDWIKQQSELDSGRVAVHGGSYGGYMVLASLVHYGDRLRAGVDWVGISNFVSFLANTKAYRRDLRRAEYGDERDAKMKAFLQKISPLESADKIGAPLFVLQGANDPRVPRSEAEQLVEAVRSAGLPVWYLLAHNEGHGFRKKENRDLAQMLTTLFFEVVGVAGEQSE